MGYHIEAYLDKGIPTLKIWDCDKKALHLNWSYQGNQLKQNESTQSEVHSLFRQLLLLTLKQDVSNVRVFKISDSLTG